MTGDLGVRAAGLFYVLALAVVLGLCIRNSLPQRDRVADSNLDSGTSPWAAAHLPAYVPLVALRRFLRQRRCVWRVTFQSWGSVFWHLHEHFLSWYSEGEASEVLGAG